MKHFILVKDLGYGTKRVSLLGSGMPGTGQTKVLGPEEKKRVAKRKSRERKIERKEDIKAYGEALDE